MVVLDFGQIAADLALSEPGSSVAQETGMGAPRAFDNPWTSTELDDGWSLEEEEPTRPRALPATPTIVNVNTCFDDEETIADWSLAREEERSVPAVAVHSALVNPLTDAELEEFARAELAMGTEVGAAVSEELWFEDLCCIVPRRRAPSVCDQLPSAKPLAKLPLLAKPEEFSPPSEPAPAPPAKKARWWKRFKRS